MFVTPSIIVRLDKRVQPLKAELPMVVTPGCRVTRARPVQLSKALTPIAYTLPGSVSDASPVQLLNALSPIVSWSSPGVKVRLVSPVQPLNASLSIVVTLLGMDISFRLVQPKKALPPMDVIWRWAASGARPGRQRTSQSLSGA